MTIDNKDNKQPGVVAASSCKCIVCGKQAVAFWPVCDPDIKSNPYCRKHLDEVQIKLLIAIQAELK